MRAEKNIEMIATSLYFTRASSRFNSQPFWEVATQAMQILRLLLEQFRDWLKDLPATERKTIGEDIKTVQFGWPLGMPLVRKLSKDLWEVRIRLEEDEDHG